MSISDSDSEIIQQQIEAISYYIPKRKKIGGRGKFNINNDVLNIQNQCLKLMDSILIDKIQKTAQSIYQLINTNWQSIKSFNNSLIIAVQFKRDQQNQIKLLNQKIQQVIQKQLNKKKMQQNQTLEDKKNNKKSNKKIINLDIHYLSPSDVRDIALQIKIKQDQKQQKQFTKQQKNLKQQTPRRNLYLTKRITNLTKDNIFIFQNKQIKCGNIIVIATNQSLKIIDDQVNDQTIIQQNQRFFHRAYDNKQLFCQYMYRCIASRTIMAYLPKQILQLIQMYDFYPMSYKQGCKMLIYTIKLIQYLWKIKNKAKKQQVQIKQLVRTFNKTWSKFGTGFGDQVIEKANHEKLNHCFLDGNYKYQISQNKIQLYLKKSNLQHFYDQDLTSNFYSDFLKLFRKKLLQNDALKHLVLYLDQIQQKKQKYQQMQKAKNSKNRAYLLGIQKFTKKSPHEQFQNKITNFLHKATALVRQQAKQIEWKDLKIYETLNPQIPRIISQSILYDPQLRDAFNTIRCSSQMPLGSLLQNMKRTNQSKLAYIVRCLQLKGLIEINKHSIRPSLVTNYYQKATFAMEAE